MEEGGYRNSLEHILDELKMLDLQLLCGVLKFRSREGENNWNNYSGLYISDKEINNILSPNITDTTFNCPENIQVNIHKLEEGIKMRIDFSLKKRINLCLVQISKRLGLSDFETRVLLIALAPELDSKYERIYAYLHNDVTKKRPTMGLILDLLCNSIEEKVRFRRFFRRSSKLFKFRILQYNEAKDGPNFWHILSTPILIDEHITSLILQHERIDWKIEPFTELFNLEENNRVNLSSEQFIYQDLREQILAVLKRQSFRNQEDTIDLNYQKTIFYFMAIQGTGKKTLAKRICHEIGLPLLIADLYKAENYYKMDFEDAIELLFREALLQDAILFLDNFDGVLKNRFSNDSDNEYNSKNDNKLSKDNSIRFDILLRNITNLAH